MLGAILAIVGIVLLGLSYLLGVDAFEIPGFVLMIVGWLTIRATASDELKAQWKEEERQKEMIKKAIEEAERDRRR